MSSRSYLLKSGVAAAALLISTAQAHAQEADFEADAGVSADADADATARMPTGRLSLVLQPGLAVAASDPQAENTELGFDQTVKLFFGLSRSFSLGPSATFTTLPPTSSMAESGTAWSFGASARLMRPHDAAPGRNGIHALSPWVDADLLYVRTGELNRPGFAVGAGLAMPLDRDRSFWFGPFVRYFQIVQGERSGFDNRDAKVFTIGLSLEVGPGLERRPVAMAALVEDEPEVVDEAPEAEPAPLAAADRDQDGVDDDADHCPDVAGRADLAGCPPAEVAVAADPPEVTEKISFQWDSAELERGSYPALDEVVQALRDNPTYRVEVGGHASSDGDEEHNQQLSEERASAVGDYLVAHGVSRDRVTSRGFSSSVPISTNRTVDGRGTNRRVEFVVRLIIVNEGTP